LKNIYTKKADFMRIIPIKKQYPRIESVKSNMRLKTKFEATTKQIAELCLYLSVPEIQQVIPEYLPSQRTIYRRLERFGISRPDTARKNFEKELIKAAPSNLTDEEVKEDVEQEIEERLVNLIEQIEKEAEAHKERMG